MINWFRRKETTINLADYKRALGWFGTKSGVDITHDTALDVTTVLACVRVIAEDVAKLPINVFTRADDQESIATNHPLQKLLTIQPNSWQTPFEFFEGVTIQSVLTGWGFALRNVNPRGELLSLIPVVSGNVDIDEGRNGVALFTVRDNHGEIIGQFTPGQIMILRGPIWDQHRALDVVSRAREAIGLAAVTEATQSNLHANGGRPSGILSAPTQLKKPALDRLREAWEEMHGGAENSFKTAVLDSGIEFKPMTMTGVDAQHMETRRFQIEEVCRAMKVFPQMVGHADKTSTYASAEAFFAAHFRHTIWPWLERWRQVINRDLISKRSFYVEFDTTNFSRASLKDRADAYRSFVELGIYTRNEIRKIEGLEALPGLDEPLTPMNMGSNDE